MKILKMKIHETLNASIEAWRTKNKKLLLSLYNDDSILFCPVGISQFMGIDQISRFWNFAHQKCNNLKINPVTHNTIICANECILNSTIEVRMGESKKGFDLYTTQYIVFGRDGKIQTKRVFWDENYISTPDGLELLASADQINMLISYLKN